MCSGLRNRTFVSSIKCYFATKTLSMNMTLSMSMTYPQRTEGTEHQDDGREPLTKQVCTGIKCAGRKWSSSHGSFLMEVDTKGVSNNFSLYPYCII